MKCNYMTISIDNCAILRFDYALSKNYASVITIFIIFIYIYSVNVTYIGKTGDKTRVKGKVGDNVLYLAHRWGIDMEG